MSANEVSWRSESRGREGLLHILSGIREGLARGSLSVPYGTDRAGLSGGVRLAADRGAEGVLLLRPAAQLEEAAPCPLRAADCTKG
jgi:hypothetical protein